MSRMIFAHRGLSGRYPENTMAAFEAALQTGAHGIELDVQLSKDGQLVIIHDEEVNRTTDGTGYIRDFKYEDIKQLDAGSWFNKSSYGIAIPTLDEVFEWATKQNNHLMINVELKNDVIRYEGMEEKVLALINRYGISDRIILSSFNPESLRKIRMLDSDIQIGYLILGMQKNAVTVAENIGANAIHCEAVFALSEYGQKAIERGLPLRVYTINTLSEGEKLLAAGTEVIMTDYPDLFMQK
ncbi:glycerophosphodiester phosphodiesterase [Cytobacillus horneckiae]|uniref:glycerophosphodiester phosphodiesterase n=1 Tax=Cytobacillus horneckiae TaxID=549687 RepID=UPI0039A18980